MRTPKQTTRSRLTVAGLLKAATLLLAFSTSMAQRPANMLASPFSAGITVSDYLVSEKLDGVRARWDGTKLISRSGRSFKAPQWFIDGFPATQLDGELWSRRGEYQRIASITARQYPHDDWRELRFMVFDLPHSEAEFQQRYAELKQTVLAAQAPYLAVIEQFEVNDEANLLRQFKDVVLAGGEGLMLHHKAARYRAGRSSQLLKLKQFDDAEARVIGYRGGKGKYQAMTGALLLETDDGRRFYVGSGMSDADRKKPPALGAIVRYQYSGFTNSGLPRFPVFLGPRYDFDQ